MNGKIKALIELFAIDCLSIVSSEIYSFFISVLYIEETETKIKLIKKTKIKKTKSILIEYRRIYESFR